MEREDDQLVLPFVASRGDERSARARTHSRPQPKQRQRRRRQHSRGVGGVRARRNVPHRERPEHKHWHPMHVTLRAVHGLPSFRQQVLYGAFVKAFRTTRREGFRIVEFSVQSNHLHLLVEARDKEVLARGMMSFAVRANRLFNSAHGRMRGRVWAERYHRHDLTTPREVRNALVYVLNNALKHGGRVPGPGLFLDACSSARWFVGWFRTRSPDPDEPPRPTEPPDTFLLEKGWKKWGLLHPSEAPAAR